MKKTVVMAAVMIFASPSAFSQENPPPSKLPIERVKERYWDKGREAELRVVQNRLYSKAHKFEIGLSGGWISTDPFLSVKTLGGTIGYHMSDAFAVTVVGWKDFASNSSALDLLEASKNVTANTNIPSYFVGAELDYVPIYGKLSLLGSSIIYFDMHLDAGAGVTKTETGNNFTPFVGVGEQIYLNSWSSLRIDYRLTRYSEDLRQKTLGAANLGNIVESRTQWDSVVTLGLTVFGSIF